MTELITPGSSDAGLTQDLNLWVVDALCTEIGSARADAVYGSLAPIGDDLSDLLHGNRSTPQLSVTERQQIVDFAQTEALRLVAEGIVPNSVMFPVDVVSVANNLGVCVKEMPIDVKTQNGNSIAGFIVKPADQSCAVIFVASTSDSNRKRSSISHELGHYVTWRREIPADQWLSRQLMDICSVEEGDTDPVQFCANSFMHKQLIPDYALAEKLQEGPSIDELSNVFGMSPDSVRRRMTYLSLVTQTYPAEYPVPSGLGHFEAASQ